jgi:hypothetical protein
MVSSTAYKRRLESRIKVLTMILRGLSGEPFTWLTVGETKAYFYLAREMGVSLTTRSQAAKKGLRLKPKAKPIGSGQFGSGTSTAQFFIEQVHFEVEGEQ